MREVDYLSFVCIFVAILSKLLIGVYFEWFGLLGVKHQAKFCDQVLNICSFIFCGYGRLF
jgi:hypothetical protein